MVLLPSKADKLLTATKLPKKRRKLIRKQKNKMLESYLSEWHISTSEKPIVTVE